LFSSGGHKVQLRVGIRSVALLLIVLGTGLGGCGTLRGDLGSDHLHAAFLGSGAPATRIEAEPLDGPSTTAAAVGAESGPAAEAPAPEATFVPVTLEPMPPERSSLLLAFVPPSRREPTVVLAQKSGPPDVLPDTQIAEYDPWQRYNEKVFSFNYHFDKYVLKPVAQGYDFVMPDVVQQMIGNAFENINVVPKLANNLLQGNWKGFGTELGRFVINSTLGIGGLFDIARQEFGLEKTRADFGQTLGKWGLGPGPYVIVPLLPPLTVRDGIGYGVDVAMDPLTYVLPFIWDRLGMRLGDIVNDRSLNLDLFQGIEESTLDLYSATRNGYLQRRENLIHGTR
jgi:phospholipid-binding lipoprotein MlaA